MIYNLERAIRTNDINLFCHAITPVINILIATNHINYSRWRTQFQLDLLNIDNTHPGLRAILEGGAFSVRRTNKPFSRAPLDLTLEQTVNCDAASRLIRLSSATNNYSARLRWMSSRAAVISMAQEMTGLTSIDGTTAELHPSRIESDLQKVLVQIQDSCDPFKNTSEKLFNISSGKAASQPVQSCLLGNAEKGNERHKYFMSSCFSDSTNFEKPIKKEKLETFRYECKGSRRNPDKRIAALVAPRDLMGRRVILATKTDLGLKYVLTYPLTPVSLSMCSADGIMANKE